jgi:hypothetical protein
LFGFVDNPHTARSQWVQQPKVTELLATRKIESVATLAFSQRVIDDFQDWERFSNQGRDLRVVDCILLDVRFLAIGHLTKELVDDITEHAFDDLTVRFSVSLIHGWDALLHEVFNHGGY